MTTTGNAGRRRPMHADQLIVPLETVRALVTAQFPEWAHLPISAAASGGTVNAIFRIGERIAARFPLRPGDVDAVRRSLQSEADAARELAGGTRFPVPAPIALGRPGPGYPLPWSVQTWIPGVTATDDDPGASVEFAHDLAQFITDVRGIELRGRTSTGRRRGGELRGLDGWMETCFRRSGRLLDVPRLRRLWRRFRALPRPSSDAMSHGDLIPGNVLVAGGRLTGVLDVGNLGPADPALDLVSAWHLLEPGPRRQLRNALQCDDGEWERGKGWAFEQAMGLVWYYVDSNPGMCRLGRRTLDRLLAEEPTENGSWRTG